MIAYLKGTLMGTQSGKWIVDVHDVGYEVFVPSHYSTRRDVELWIYTHVREDMFHLYGFELEQEKDVFVTLIGISGIGPKVALGILSSISYADLMKKVEEEDITSLCKLPKVGRKLAQQMVLSLKDKWSGMKKVEKDSQEEKVQNEISVALMRLGFRSVEIKSVLEKIDMKAGVESGLRHALSMLHGL